MNERVRKRGGRNGEIQPFFKFGTAVAIILASPEGPGFREKGNSKMSLFKANNAFAVIAAFAISAICMAAAIVPASPSGLIA